jgi:hypothetical protein
MFSQVLGNMKQLPFTTLLGVTNYSGESANYLFDITDMLATCIYGWKKLRRLAKHC